jgi:integrase/recombinase XerD
MVRERGTEPVAVSVAWLDTTLLTGQLAPSSRAAYQSDLAGYLRFCGGELVQALDAGMLARWRTDQAQHTRLSPSTINRHLAGVKRVVQEAAAQGYLDVPTAEAFRRVPGVPVKALKDRLKVPTRITAGHMRQLVDAPNRNTLRGWRDRALLLTLATSGCRVSEIVSLTTAQIRSEAGSFFLEVLGKNETAPRLAPLAHDAYAAVQAWLSRRPVESPYVFTRVVGKGTSPPTKPLDRSTAWRIVARYARHVGLQHVSPHSFRRFVGTELARKDIRQAQKALGHVRIETTARHYVLDALVGGLTDGLF